MRVLILFTLLVFCSNLLAQSASDHKPACEGAVDLTIDLQQPWNKTSGTALPKISGTNVNVDVHYAATLTDPSTVTWSELKVWIGSQLLALPNGWEQGTIRFASTYFPDSVEDLAFRVSVNYVVHNPVTNCSENGTLDATLHLDPYNKSLNWGTRLNRYGQLWIPFVQDSTLGTSQGGAKLNEMGHACLPSAGGNPCLNYSITQMMADAAIGTCLLTFAHGNPGVTHDSFNEVVMFQDWNTAMDSFDDVVGPAVEAGFPRWNLAILKSCSVLAYGNDPRPGLRMSDPGDLWRDRAVLGFEKDVYAYLKLGDATDPIQTSQCTDYSAWHSIHFLNYLKDGDTVQQAKIKADASAPARGEPAHIGTSSLIPYLPSTLRGDQFGRLYYVYYQNEAEKTALEAAMGNANIWYWCK